MGEKLIRYDYQDIEVKKHFKWLYMDYYPCFGWETMEVMPSEKRDSNLHISFRRNYDVRGKDRLCHYQAKFDGCMEEIRNLEIARKFSATVSAVTIGMIGMIFIIGTLLLVGNGVPAGFLLLIPGFLLFLLSYPCYLVVERNKRKQIEPFVEERYNELYQISQAAKQILEKS